MGSEVGMEVEVAREDIKEEERALARDAARGDVEALAKDEVAWELVA